MPVPFPSLAPLSTAIRERLLTLGEGSLGPWRGGSQLGPGMSSPHPTSPTRQRLYPTCETPRPPVQCRVKVPPQERQVREARDFCLHLRPAHTGGVPFQEKQATVQPPAPKQWLRDFSSGGGGGGKQTNITGRPKSPPKEVVFIQDKVSCFSNATEMSMASN